MLEKGEIGSSLLELGFVRTGVPGTRHIPPFLLFSLCTSLSGSSLSSSLEEHPRSTLYKSISELELKYSGKIGYVLANLPSNLDALLGACLGYCIPQYA